jgi:ABC-type enterochelin transport system permease subunit
VLSDTNVAPLSACLRIAASADTIQIHFSMWENSQIQSPHIMGMDCIYMHNINSVFK